MTLDEPPATMPPVRVTSRGARFLRVVLVVVVVLLAVLAGPLSWTRGSAQDVLTNDSVIGMVKAGLAESVIIQKIRASPQKFDTSTDGLIKLKHAGVPDTIVESMISLSALAAAATSPGDPAIAHVSAAGTRPLKPARGEIETSVAPFAGSRQEVVIPASPAAVAARADLRNRLADQPPSGSVGARASKPGKNDRNLPISRNSGVGWAGTTFRQIPIRSTGFRWRTSRVRTAART
jgi:hypothetical protein